MNSKYKQIQTIPIEAISVYEAQSTFFSNFWSGVFYLTFNLIGYFLYDIVDFYAAEDGLYRFLDFLYCFIGVSVLFLILYQFKNTQRFSDSSMVEISYYLTMGALFSIGQNVLYVIYEELDPVRSIDHLTIAMIVLGATIGIVFFIVTTGKKYRQHVVIKAIRDMGELKHSLLSMEQAKELYDKFEKQQYEQRGIKCWFGVPDEFSIASLISH